MVSAANPANDGWGSPEEDQAPRPKGRDVASNGAARAKKQAAAAPSKETDFEIDNYDQGRSG